MLMLNNLIKFKDYSFLNESMPAPPIRPVIVPVVSVERDKVKEKIEEVKETWKRIRKNRSIIDKCNLDEDIWNLREGEDLSSAWFHGMIKECLADYKKFKRRSSVQEQVISDLNEFNNKLLSIEQNLASIRNKIK